MNIQKLLLELDDVGAFMADHVSRQHLQSLCKQASAAIRQLQLQNARGFNEAHAVFLTKLGDGLHELSRRMQDHA